MFLGNIKEIHEVHKWRSRMLRLMMPLLRDNNSDVEEGLRIQTNDLIKSYANQQVSDFLASPARLLVRIETEVEFTTRITKFYNEMAILAYEL